MLVPYRCVPDAVLGSADVAVGSHTATRRG